MLEGGGARSPLVTESNHMWPVSVGRRPQREHSTERQESTYYNFTAYG